MLNTPNTVDNERPLATQLENNIENGNITPKQLQENSPIQKEAEQITDSNPHNDEVKDDAVEDFVEKHPEEAEQILYDDRRNDEANDKKIGHFLNKGVNWDNVKVYEPGEDATNLVSGYRREGDKLIDEYGNEPKDYEPIDTEGGVLLHRDEDFLGPDEQTINDGLPAETDWDYAVENVPELRELNDELDEEDREEIAKLLGLKFGGKSGSLNDPSQDSQATNDIKLNKPSSSLGSIGFGFLGKTLTGNVSPSHVGSGVNFNTRMDSVKSIASKAPVPPEAASTKSKAVSGSNNNLPHSNGTIGSGAGMMFQKRNSDLKVKGSNLPDLGGPHHQSEVEELNVDDIVDEMTDKLVENLEKLLNEHPELGEQLGFDHNGYKWYFKGISLDELPIDKINSLTNSLRKLV